MSRLGRILPLLAFLAVLWLVQDLTAPLFELGKSAATHAGMTAELAKMAKEKNRAPASEGRAKPDAWGTPCRVETLPEIIRLRSAGPDRAFNTSDDILAEVPNKPFPRPGPRED